VLERTIESDRLYVMDRGYAKFVLFNKIVAAQSSYVCRLRDNSVYDVLEARPLTEADRAAEVLSDQIVRFTKGKSDARPDHALRLVCVKCSPHTSRGKYRGGSSGVDSDGVLRIATNLLDVPAEIIALIYSWRWAIEIFFRFFKHLLGCRHLLSHSQNGIEIQTYCAIIACLLISLWTGRKPTLRTYEMICFYFCGLASEDELLAHLAKLKRQDEAAAKKTAEKQAAFHKL
jgi:IS4 transposase